MNNPICIVTISLMYLLCAMRWLASFARKDTRQTTTDIAYAVLYFAIGSWIFYLNR